MLVDVHSHYLNSGHFSEDFKRQVARARGGLEVNLTVRWEEYS
jgi:hypothetical protein